MITKDGINVRIWQDTIDGPITLHVEETERGSDGDAVEVVLTAPERSMLREMLSDFKIGSEYT